MPDLRGCVGLGQAAVLRPEEEAVHVGQLHPVIVCMEKSEETDTSSQKNWTN
jgi:hypothetical protein